MEHIGSLGLSFIIVFILAIVIGLVLLKSDLDERDMSIKEIKEKYLPFLIRKNYSKPSFWAKVVAFLVDIFLFSACLNTCLGDTSRHAGDDYFNEMTGKSKNPAPFGY